LHSDAKTVVKDLASFESGVSECVSVYRPELDQNRKIPLQKFFVLHKIATPSRAYAYLRW